MPLLPRLHSPSRLTDLLVPVLPLAQSWSGCKDSQTSADTQEAGKATGAMSYAFIAALSRNPTQSYQQLLNSIRDELRGKYDQKPQLSSSHPMDTTVQFIC